MEADFFAIVSALRTGRLVLIDGRTYAVNGIEREDGSGHSFNLKVSRMLQSTGKFEPSITIYWTDAGK